MTTIKYNTARSKARSARRAKTITARQQRKLRKALRRTEKAAA